MKDEDNTMSEGLQLLADNLGVDEENIPMFGVASIVYMTPEGHQSYSTSFLGVERSTSFVGLLEFMKVDAMERGQV